MPLSQPQEVPPKISETLMVSGPTGLESGKPSLKYRLQEEVT